MSPRFPCATPVVENFSSDLLQAIINYWVESYLQHCRISVMELFNENSHLP